MRIQQYVVHLRYSKGESKEIVLPTIALYHILAGIVCVYVKDAKLVVGTLSHASIFHFIMFVYFSYFSYFAWFDGKKKALANKIQQTKQPEEFKAKEDKKVD